MPQQIVSFFLALFMGAAPVSSTAAATPAKLARLEVRISTSSTWTQVTLSPGRIAAQRPVSVPAGVKVAPLASGWVLNTPGGRTRTVVLSAVFEEPTGARAIRLSVRKGHAGTTTVDVQNRSRNAFHSARLINKLPRSTNGVKAKDGLTAVLTKSRRQIFGAADPLLGKADPNRLVLAAYYPWFGAGTYGDPRFADRPADPRSTSTWEGVLSMTRQARSAGIDGFVVSWQGKGSERGFDLALAAARATGGVVSPYLEMLHAREPGSAGDRADPAVVLRWLTDALERADNPAFLRSGGIPVVFVWSAGRLSRIQWHNILAELSRRGTPVRLVGDAEGYGAVQWGYHEYNPNFQTPAGLARSNRDAMLDARLLGSTDAVAPHLYVATVSPGYDDSRYPGRTSPVVSRGEAGSRYLETWDAALAARPDWILITSWNEWFEGTVVEPSVRHGSLALAQTAERSARFAE